MEGKQNPSRMMGKFSCAVLDIMLRHNHSEWVEVGGMGTVFLGTEEGKEYTVHSRTGSIVMWLCGRDGAFRISAIISISLSCGGRGKMRQSQCVQERRTWAKPQCRQPLTPPVVSSLPALRYHLGRAGEGRGQAGLLLALKTMYAKGLRMDSGCRNTEDGRYMQGHRVMLLVPFRKYIDS